VILSERYITDRFLPDKAIDVLDEAGSRANIKNVVLLEYEALKEELKKVQEEKENAVSADSIEDYQKAADLKVRECKLLQQIKELEQKSKDMELTVDDIAYVIESWTRFRFRGLQKLKPKNFSILKKGFIKESLGSTKL